MTDLSALSDDDLLTIVSVILSRPSDTFTDQEREDLAAINLELLTRENGKVFNG